MKDYLGFSLIVLIGSGIGTFIAQKLFELRINKTLFRYTQLYSEKLAIIRELYSLLNKAERALDTLLSKREPKEEAANENYRRNTIDVITRFIVFFEENEIIFDEKIVARVKQINDKMNEAINTHNVAEQMEEARGSDAWEKTVTNKQNMYNQLIKHEFPELKLMLKQDFQNKYNLIEE